MLKIPRSERKGRRMSDAALEYDTGSALATEKTPPSEPGSALYAFSKDRAHNLNRLITCSSAASASGGARGSDARWHVSWNNRWGFCVIYPWEWKELQGLDGSGISGPARGEDINQGRLHRLPILRRASDRTLRLASQSPSGAEGKSLFQDCPRKTFDSEIHSKHRATFYFALSKGVTRHWRLTSIKE